MMISSLNIIELYFYHLTFINVNFMTLVQNAKFLTCMFKTVHETHM